MMHTKIYKEYHYKQINNQILETDNFMVKNKPPITFSNFFYLTINFLHQISLRHPVY